MRDELDRLRLAVDEATTQVIETECDLEAARKVEEDAAVNRREAESLRNAAMQQLAAARAALDARLGIAPVPAPPVRPFVAPVHEDDDDAIRDP